MNPSSIDCERKISLALTLTGFFVDAMRFTFLELSIFVTRKSMEL